MSSDLDAWGLSFMVPSVSQSSILTASKAWDGVTVKRGCHAVAMLVGVIDKTQALLSYFHSGMRAGLLASILG